MSLQYNLFVAK